MSKVGARRAHTNRRLSAASRLVEQAPNRATARTRLAEVGQLVCELAQSKPIHFGDGSISCLADPAYNGANLRATQ